MQTQTWHKNFIGVMRFAAVKSQAIVYLGLRFSRLDKAYSEQTVILDFRNRAYEESRHFQNGVLQQL